VTPVNRRGTTRFTYQFLEIDSRVWLQGFRNLLAHGDHREADYLAAMLLALGLQNAKPEGLPLVEECFERVHRLASDDAIPDNTWIILDPIVPHLLWLHDWDKCERLRQGLIESFVRFRWPFIRLADCAKSQRLLSRVMDSAKNVDGGREFVSQTS
jgi:hypothetical protein